MSRLAEAGVTDLTWTEEDGTIYAEGHQSYEIDTGNELATFNGAKCVSVVSCFDLAHAVAMVTAAENVCAWHLRMGTTWHGKAITGEGVPA